VVTHNKQHMNSVWILSFLFLFLNNGSTATSIYPNLNGEELKLCSHDGMAFTGYMQNGHCVDQNDDSGSHDICINLSSISSSGQNFCTVMAQSNWCDGTDMPCHEDQSKSCAIKNWCVCQWAFASYITKAGGCTAIQDIQCGTNKMQAMKLYKEYNRYCEALDSINVRCMNPKNVE
jgi:uncharacterized protein (DUF2237 family)